MSWPKRIETQQNDGLWSKQCPLSSKSAKLSTDVYANIRSSRVCYCLVRKALRWLEGMGLCVSWIYPHTLKSCNFVDTAIQRNNLQFMSLLPGENTPPLSHHSLCLILAKMIHADNWLCGLDKEHGLYLMRSIVMVDHLAHKYSKYALYADVFFFSPLSDYVSRNERCGMHSCK